MNFCENCGEEIAEGNAFCDKCGHKADETATPAPPVYSTGCGQELPRKVDNPASVNSPAYERALRMAEGQAPGSANKKLYFVKGGSGGWLFLSIIFFAASFLTLCAGIIGISKYIIGISEYSNYSSYSSYSYNLSNIIDATLSTGYLTLSIIFLFVGIGFTLAFYLSKITNNLDYLEFTGRENNNGNSPAYERALRIAEEKAFQN
jgi:hypothetical protein